MILPQFHVINEAKGIAQRLWQFIDEPDAESKPQGRICITSASGIKFDNVSFTYPVRLDAPVLNGLSFHINHGETVAIVGSSGSGTRLLHSGKTK
jgi:ATP-binding cassette, subfamily B, bacterial